MHKLKKSSHIRSVLKGISWRIIATTDTVLVVLLVTCLTGECSLESALKIGASEFIVKLLIYYAHERLWLQILDARAETNKQILFKSVSWRVVATATTFIITGVILEAFDEIALYIALTELFTKFILYYLHEKLWLKIPLGKIRNFLKRNSWKRTL
ncbi:MAG: hypothetical protein Wins2KO_32040 [Winogradskyella sp.]